MDKNREELEKSLALIADFVEESMGRRPDRGEIARALRRYFVLKEISEHIAIEWDEPC